MTDKSKIPEGWSEQKIEAITSLQRDNVPTEEQEGLPHVGLEHLQQFSPRISSESSDNVSSNKYRFEKGDILFGQIRSYLEKVCIADREGVCSTDIFVIKPDDVNRNYLWSRLLSGEVNRWSQRASTGTKMPRVQWDAFANKEVPVPPVDEQERIASVLYSVDKHVERLEERHSHLQDLKHGLMQDLLTGETRVNPDVKVRDGVLIGEKNEIHINQDWAEKRYEEIADITGGGTPDTDNEVYWGGEIKWVVPSEVTGRPEVEFSETERTLTQEGLDNTSTTVLPSKSVLITSRATVGVPVINEVPMATNQGFQSFDLSDANSVNPYYLYYQIEYNSDYIDSIASGGTFDEISNSELGKLKLDVPPLWEQERIASILYNADEMIKTTAKLRDKYERVKRGLMQDLLSGNVRTPKDLEILDEVKD